MTELKNYPSIDSAGNPIEISIASGPVIIQDGKVLLDKHGDDEFWKFPGGKQRDTESFQETAIREAKEELGIDVTLEGAPVVVSLEMDGKQVLLIHYRATMTGEPRPGRDVREWGWHDVHDLPSDCAPNIKIIVDKLLN